jgi:hypothetical protein
LTSTARKGKEPSRQPFRSFRCGCARRCTRQKRTNAVLQVSKPNAADAADAGRIREMCPSVRNASATSESLLSITRLSVCLSVTLPSVSEHPRHPTLVAKLTLAIVASSASECHCLGGGCRPSCGQGCIGAFLNLHDATLQSARWTCPGVTSGRPARSGTGNLARDHRNPKFGSLTKRPWRSGASTLVEATPPWRKISRSLILELLPHRYVASSQAAGAQLKLTRTRAADTLAFRTSANSPVDATRSPTTTISLPVISVGCCCGCCHCRWWWPLAGLWERGLG